MALVGGAVAAAAPDDDWTVGKPLGKFILEEGLAQFGHMVLAVGLEGPHELSGAPPGEDVVVRAVPNERLALITMIKLTGSGQLAVGASQKRGLKAAVPQRQKLRALC